MIVDEIGGRMKSIPVLLIVGALLGVAGTFVPDASLRGLCWGIDGVMLVVGTALLTIHYFRLGRDVVAAGFLVFAVGEALILSVANADPATSAPVFGAGAALWSASLIMVGAPKVMPAWVRLASIVAAVLFAFVALHIFFGFALSPLTKPLPFFAYPFLVATLIGWALAYRNSGSKKVV